MQSLYEWEFRGNTNLDDIVARNIHEFEKDVDAIYVHKVISGVIENIEAINALIVEAAPEWPLDQVARIDKNTLRVALYEMLYDSEEDVPPRVSINEAIEIGKTFGSDSSPKFVNGVLGFVYRKFEDKLRPRDER
jgi:N utilization substance protein B